MQRLPTDLSQMPAPCWVLGTLVNQTDTCPPVKGDRREKNGIVRCLQVSHAGEKIKQKRSRDNKGGGCLVTGNRERGVVDP